MYILSQNISLTKWNVYILAQVHHKPVTKKGYMLDLTFWERNWLFSYTVNSHLNKTLAYKT